MKNSIFTLIAIFIGTSLFAQPLNKETFASMVTTAEEQEALKDYYNARLWYQKAYDESKDRDIYLKIADLSYAIRDFRKAERTYRSVLRRDKKDEMLDKRYNYAISLKMNGKYKEAIKEFDRFIAGTSDATQKELAEIEKQGAEYASVAQQAKDLTISNAGKKINTKFSEYSPFIGPDGKTIYYTSFEKDEVIIIDKDNTDYHAKIYMATAGENGWENPTVMDENINRPGYLNSNLHISPNGKQMFFCRQLLEGNELKESKIYVSNYRDGGWGPAAEVTGVNGDFIARAPAVGELFGNTVLFFSANMDGGEGGYDVYYSTLKGDGVYADPVNLGPRINTIADEIDPFYRDGMLYFSSNGHPGIGGLDVFQSEWNGVRWSDPTNMGLGYNSSFDDRSFMLDREGYRGLLTSNRTAEGSQHLPRLKNCCDDIYNINLRKIVADLVVTAFDSKEKTPLNGVRVELIEVADESPKAIDSKKNGSGNSFDFPLEIDKSYLVVGSAENYKNDTVSFATVGLLDNRTFEEMLNLEPLPKTITITKEEPFVMENIYYDFNDDKILPTAEPDLNLIYELLTEYSDMRIELSSHTDARGSDALNNDLSQRRAESARRWLINKGQGAIKRFRIEAKGYGKNQPKTVTESLAAKHSFLKVGDVLTEEFINALPSEEEQEAAHQINRRTEFKITAGPTSIKIEETRLIQIGNKKVDETINKSNDKKTLPKMKQADPPVEIHRFSSLYGRKSLKGIPVMQFDDRMVNMGTVKKGDKKEHTYKFKNIGDTTIEIDLINTCDCTEAEESRRTIKPGESGEIHVIFDSTEKEFGETIDIDIFLKNRTPGDDMPIIETIKYEFEIEK